MMMSHSFSRNLPMNRNASGTAWLPDTMPMYGHGKHLGKWMFMLMGNMFLRYTHQDVTRQGSRGGEKFDLPKWLMLMGQREVGARGLFHFNIMPSLDFITVGNEGYPLLFQTGETYQGRKLVDRQHPHDLLSEVSIAYTHMVSKDMDITGYLGYPGEPALGPVTFMHRNSAFNLPDAPLGHHWQDATHISFGVATLGVRYGIFKAEGSLFTGREPDEVRYNFDKPRFDSYSFRLLCNPTKQLALQISRGYLKSPEAAEPEEDIVRTTASLTHVLPLAAGNHYIATSIVWGLNGGSLPQNALLFESNLQWNRAAVYGRYEWVQKSAEELDLPQFHNGHPDVFVINAFTLGINYTFLRRYANNATFGIQGTANVTPAKLIPLYGKTPLAAEVYIRLSPHLMHMH